MKKDSRPVHIYPVNDLLKHEIEGKECFCNPKIKTGEYDTETGLFTKYESLIIEHNAWDKRN